jgi:ribose 5-phosphate isomerase A
MSDALKKRAAEEAVREVKSGMILGLGTGSTAKFAVEMIGERYRRGELTELSCVPTSEATRALAESYGLPLAPIDRYSAIDLAIDGADEVDPRLDLIKGLGGALLREKAVEIKTKRFIVIVDESKLVTRLGTKAPLPVEAPRDRWRELEAELRALGCQPSLRGGPAEPRTTDGGNYLIDCRFASGIDDAPALAARLDRTPGVIGHGLFLGMANLVIVAAPEGIRLLERG